MRSIYRSLTLYNRDGEGDVARHEKTGSGEGRCGVETSKSVPMRLLQIYGDSDEGRGIAENMSALLS